MKPTEDQIKKQQQQKQQQELQEEMYDQLLKSCLEQDAIERLNNVALVKPESYQQVRSKVVSMYQQGLIKQKVTQAEIIQMLESVQRKSIPGKITFMRRKEDSDDEENNQMVC